MARVEWRTKGIFKSDAEKVNTEIQKMGGEITPAKMVEYARDHKKSELHKCFEWDDAVAAEKYRLVQAGNVLRMLVIVTDDEEVPPVRVFSKTSIESTYAPTRTFLVNQEEHEQLLKRAYAELEAFRRKYATLSELEAVFAAIDEL